MRTKHGVNAASPAPRQVRSKSRCAAAYPYAASGTSAEAEATFQAEQPQFHARRVVEDLAVALQASLLVRHSTPAVADAFCVSRLAGESGRVYGTLPGGVDAAAIIERALPA